MSDPNCKRCGGSGEYLMPGDAHRSEGIVPCSCETPKMKRETAGERTDRLRANLAGPSNLGRHGCRRVLQSQGKAYPRTCAVCGLGPCRMPTAAGGEGRPAVGNWVQALLEGPIDHSRVDPRVYARAAAVSDLITELRSGPASTEKLRRLAELVISEIN